MDEWQLQQLRDQEAEKIRAGMTLHETTMNLMAAVVTVFGDRMAPGLVAMAFGALTDEDKTEFRETVRSSLLGHLKSQWIHRPIEVVIHKFLAEISEELMKPDDARRKGLVAELRERVWEEVRTRLDARITQTANSILDHTTQQVMTEVRARLEAKPRGQ